MVKSLKALHDEYRRLTPSSRAQWERGRETMPGGVIKGFYYMPPHPLYAARAEGCHLWDLDGRRYVDFFNHATTMVLGHNHPAVVAAVRSELGKGLGLGGPNPKAAAVARELVGRVPSVEKVRFVNSGTEASLVAARIVRATTGKPKVAKFEGSYHGSHDALEVSTAPSVNAAGPAESPTSADAQRGMARWAAESVVVLSFSDATSVERILTERRDEIGGVFFDGQPGIMDIPTEFAHFVRDVTDRLGMVMVMDEVISFRAGFGGYQSVAGVEPDLSIYGKIIGGGFPVGAVAGRTEYMSVLDDSKGGGVFQGGTFSANNITLAAGLATLQALTPDVYERLAGLRERLEAGLRRAFRSAGVPCQVVGAGSIVNLYITDNPIVDYRARLTADAELLERINVGLANKGYWARGTGFTLSEPMTEAEIDGAVAAIEEVLAEED